MLAPPAPGYLRECFEYRTEEGALYWKERPAAHFRCSRDQLCWNLRWAGRRAGYREVKLDRRTYKEHRLIFALVHDRWPEGVLYHDANDNRGISKGKHGRYRARIQVDGRRIHLGYFARAELAHAAYCAAAVRTCDVCLVAGSR
jgi:hypothetical protein